MGKKDGVRHVSLPATRQRLTAHQGVRAAGWPVMVRCRAAFAIRTAAPGQPQLMQAAGAVAQRALGNLGKQPAELILAHHPVLTQNTEHAMVEVGQRAVGIRTTTRPHDTSAAGGARKSHRRPPEDRYREMV